MRWHGKQFIRWDDLDAFGHVNNAKYLVFVQEARVDLFWKERIEKGLKPVFDDMVVARAEVDYKIPTQRLIMIIRFQFGFQKSGERPLILNMRFHQVKVSMLG